MILSYFAGGILFSFLYLYFPILSIAFLTIALCLLLKKRNYTALILLLSGILYAFIRQHGDMSPSPDKISADVIFSDKRTLKEGYSYELLIERCFSEECPSPLRIYLQREIPQGTEAFVTMRLNLKSPHLVPGLYTKPYYTAVPIEIKIKKGSGSLRGEIERQRSQLNRLFEKVFSKKAGDLSKALITGSRDIDPNLRNSFRKTGLAHLLTISGTHFGLLFFLLVNIVKRALLLLPYRFFHKITTFISINMLAGISVLPFMLWYLFLSGMQIPALRAFIMAVAFVVGLMIGRRYYWLTGVILAVTVILLIEPASIMDISFLLSFSAVIFIGLGLEKFRRNDNLTEGSSQRLLRPVVESLIISISATAGTAPLVLYLFHYISLTGIVVNLIVTPFTCFVILPLLIFFSAIYLFTGYAVLAGPIESLINLCLKMVMFFASFKYTEINVMAFPLIILFMLYILLVLFFYEKRYRYFYIIGFIIVISFIVFRRDNTLQITFLDVGQGDSAVIELPDRKVVVIDTGREGIEASSYLKYRGKNDIDVMVITHPDTDHSGGIGLLKEDFKIKEIWDNGFLFYDESLKTLPRRSLQRGDLIRAHEYSFLVLHPYRDFSILSEGSESFENNSSLVMKFMARGYSVLFAGDIEQEAQEDIVRLGKVLRSNILKVPHHGSRDFFSLVSADISVISVAAQNPYGHPHKEVLRLLEGSRILLTSRDGSIKIVFSDRPCVKLYNEYRIKKVHGLRDELLNIKNIFRIF